jgi:L-asparaginase II
MTLRVDVLRGDTVESRHEVDYAIADSRSLPDGNAAPVFLRSAAKPFQAAAVVASGALEGIDDDDVIAIIAASHSGERKHTTVVSRLLAHLGLDESALGCGVHPPFHAETAQALRGAFTPLHHNCSGKHAGMLAVARKLGVAAECYLDREGPVQRLMRETVAAACALQPHDVVVAVDGCSALTFAVPLRHAAHAFALLARPDGAPERLREPLARVAAAMAMHPDLISGTGRFDTRLMAATGLVAKGGAEGVQGAADPRSGAGLCLKVRDGASRAVGPATLELLHAQGWIADDALRALADLRRPAIENHAGIRVGEIRAVVALR